MKGWIPLLLVGALLVAPISMAQIGPEIPETVVTWTASARPPSSAALMTNIFGEGDRVYITLSADIVDGWRVYAMDSPAGRPLTFELGALPEGVEIYGEPGRSEVEEAYDRGLEATYTYHAHQARIWQGLRINAGAQYGERVVNGTVHYAACNDELCLPVRDVPFSARFVVDG